jgi:hypothetical protein
MGAGADVAESEEWEEEEECDREESKGRERSETAEESGEGASEAEGLVEGGEKVIWMPCVPMVQSRYEAASSKSVRSDILASPIPITYQHQQTNDDDTHAHTQKVATPREKILV